MITVWVDDLLLWVDDLLLFASTTMVMKNLKKELESVFNLTDLGEPSKIVGIEISRTNETLTILQGQYIDMILQKYNMQDANPVSTPLDTNTKLKPNKKNNEPNRSNNYVSLIGSLQYLAVAMHPDIAYGINCLATYTANPALKHYSAEKRLLRYLKGTQNLGITYKTESSCKLGPPDSNFAYGFSDTSFACTDDKKISFQICLLI